MTPKQEAAMRQALEALKEMADDLGRFYAEVPAITAINEALAEQPAQPDCPECGNNRQVWDNQITGKKTCHRAGCHQEIEQPAQQQKEGFASPGGGYVPAIPRPMPLDWKLVPRKATPEMLRAMDECAQEGYDERLYEGMASSVYMAAWDASPVMGTLPEQSAQHQEPVAWPCVIAEADFEKDTITLEMQCSDYMVRAGQHWLSTSPQPSKPWVGLTEEERLALAMHENFGSVTDYACAIEAKLREKNTPQQSKGDA